MPAVQLLSDLHLEMHRDGGAGFLGALDPSGVDVLVLAGDICSADDGEALISTMGGFAGLYPRVIYVPGNHEFYGTTIAQAERGIAALPRAFPNLTVLRAGTAVEIGGRRFLGGTLWFPDLPDNDRYAGWINDFRMILGGFVPWCHEQNAALRAWLRAELREGDIVVTHHLPAHGSVAARWRGNEANRFFVSDEEALIRERRPALWMHGHTHEPCDYTLGDTRIVCNPFGYPRETKAGFREKLILGV